MLEKIQIIVNHLEPHLKGDVYKFKKVLNIPIHFNQMYENKLIGGKVFLEEGAIKIQSYAFCNKLSGIYDGFIFVVPLSLIEIAKEKLPEGSTFFVLSNNSLELYEKGTGLIPSPLKRLNSLSEDCVKEFAEKTLKIRNSNDLSLNKLKINIIDNVYNKDVINNFFLQNVEKCLFSN